jgi:hypothetical protein
LDTLGSQEFARQALQKIYRKFQSIADIQSTVPGQEKLSKEAAYSYFSPLISTTSFTSTQLENVLVYHIDTTPEKTCSFDEFKMLLQILARQVYPEQSPGIAYALFLPLFLSSRGSQIGPPQTTGLLRTPSPERAENPTSAGADFSTSRNLPKVRLAAVLGIPLLLSSLLLRNTTTTQQQQQQSSTAVVSSAESFPAFNPTARGGAGGRGGDFLSSFTREATMFDFSSSPNPLTPYNVPMLVDNFLRNENKLRAYKKQYEQINIEDTSFIEYKDSLYKLLDSKRYFSNTETQKDVLSPLSSEYELVLPPPKIPEVERGLMLFSETAVVSPRSAGEERSGEEEANRREELKVFTEDQLTRINKFRYEIIRATKDLKETDPSFFRKMTRGTVLDPLSLSGAEYRLYHATREYNEFLKQIANDRIAQELGAAGNSLVQYEPPMTFAEVRVLFPSLFFRESYL